MWLQQLPPNSAVRRLIPSVAETCPANGPEADAPRPELTAKGGERQMGVVGHAAVFAVPLRSNVVLRGKWFNFRPFKSGDDQYVPTGPASRRFFTDTDLIEVRGQDLTVIPLRYNGDLFCLDDPFEDAPSCYQAAKYDNDLALIQPHVRDNAKFDLTGVLKPIDNAAPPSEEAVNRARTARLSAGTRARRLSAEDGFSSFGLGQGRALMAIHDGRFEDAAKDVTMLQVLGLIDGYIAACSTSPCAQRLPAARKVQLTNSICDAWETETVGRLPPRTYCTHETEYRRNAFADKDMLDFRQAVGQKLAPYLAGLMSSETVPNIRPMGENLARALKPAGLLMSSQAAGSADMSGLLRLNVCDSRGIQIFEQNLKRFGSEWFTKLEPFQK